VGAKGLKRQDFHYCLPVGGVSCSRKKWHGYSVNCLHPCPAFFKEALENLMESVKKYFPDF
jgi:hypothetical protein